MVLPSYCSGPARTGVQASARSTSGTDKRRAADRKRLVAGEEKSNRVVIRFVGSSVFHSGPASTCVHTPARVDTRDHLSASADTILMYDSAGPGPLLTTDSVSWNRTNWSTAAIGRAGRGSWLRSAGKFPGGGAGEGGNRLSAHH